MDSLFSQYIHAECGSFKHARGISARVGREFHIYHEIILFLDGDAEFVSEEQRIRLAAPVLIVIPSQTYHQMVIHGEQECYYRCVLQFDGETGGPADGLGQLSGVRMLAVDGEIRYLFDKLIQTANEGADSGGQILNAVLVLLVDLILRRKDATGEEAAQNETVRRAVEYINANMAGELTIQAVAQACSVSPSSLSHIFRKEMCISLHKFIVKKRLIHARQRICAGEPATVAALESGFQDYSGFYKQYKKMFGALPSRTQPGAGGADDI